MSKRIKTILWSAIALVVLIALALTLVLTAPTEEVSVPSVETIDLIKENRSDILSVHIVNPSDEYTVELVGEELWRVRDTMDLVQKAEMFDELITDMALLSATEIIEEDCQNLERYGLSEPKYSFLLKLNNGTEYYYNIGASTADNNSYYICENGKNTVYLVPRTAVSKIFLTRYSYLDTQVLETFDKNDATQFPHVSYVKIWNASNDVTLVLDEAKEGELGAHAVSQQSHLVLREPHFSLISIDKAEAPIFGTFGLTSSDIVKANITAEDLTKYGFDHPTATFEITYNDIPVKLTLGAGFNKTDGYTAGEAVQSTKIDSYFLIREGVDQIYTVRASDIPWIDVSTKDMISSTIILPNIIDVDSFEVVADGETYDIDIIPGAIADDSSDYTAKLNGKDVDMDSVRTYMQLVMMTSAQDLVTAEPSHDPMITVTYRYVGGGESVVKVYVEDDTTTYITLNDKTMFLGRYGYVTKVLAESKDLAAGNPVDTEW